MTHLDRPHFFVNGAFCIFRPGTVERSTSFATLRQSHLVISEALMPTLPSTDSVHRFVHNHHYYYVCALAWMEIRAVLDNNYCDGWA